MENIDPILQSQELAAHFALDTQLYLVELVDRQSNRSLLDDRAVFCTLAVDGQEGRIHAMETPSAGELRLHYSGLPPETTAQLHLTLDGSSLRWRLVMGGTGAGRVHFPFLAHLQTQPTLLGQDGFQDGGGRAIFRHADWPLPVAWAGADGRTLTLLAAPEAGLGSFDTRVLWQTEGVAFDLAPEPQAVLQFELVLHDGGWPAAFDRFRHQVRARFDLAEYARPDLAWYGDQLLQHFTFLYGREILNLETGQFELERFLDEGEEKFGGYDGFLIWGVYPRIGVDERTQWDFHDDFPGGRAALREMGRQARRRGVRFFIPYKPWDRSADLHGRPGPADHEQLAQLVADVEADGVFLDTMSAIAGEFRAAIDRVRPGVVFCSEGRAKGAAFEVITGSWDQFPNRNAVQGNWSASPERMPGVDLRRFVFPEHRLFVISRHSVGDDRLRIIQRGFFNGMGWVIWQDIFGLVLAYASEEAALLRKCVAILRRHRRALWGPQPVPLLPTLAPGVYANEFPGADKRLWTFYNENDEPATGPLLQVTPRPGCHFVDAWNDQEVDVGEDGIISLALPPHSVGALVELPRLLDYAPDAGRVTLADGAPDATLQVRPLPTSRPQILPGRSVSLAQLQEIGRGPCLVEALADGELLDQRLIHPTTGGAQ